MIGGKFNEGKGEREIKMGGGGDVEEGGEWGGGEREGRMKRKRKKKEKKEIKEGKRKVQRCF